MPGSRRRTRTSSSSSVEIQVTEKVVTVSSSASTPGSAAVARAKDTVTTSSPLPLVRPIPGFLRLIQTVGAQGTASLHGELFTLKQLCGYLTSYVKHRQLWDPLNPVVVHCGKDPLGQVFQVDRFTLHDAIGLIKRSVVPLEIDHQGWTKPAGVLRGGTNVDQGRDLPYSLHQAPSVNREVIVSPSTSFARSDAGEDVADGKGRKHRKMRKRRKRKRNADKTASSASSDGGPAKVCRHSVSSDTPVKMCRRSASGDTPVKMCRRRQPSFSITYSSDVGEGGHPWQFQVEMYDSGDSEVLSIQSKVTAVVKSSEDDLWFLDDSDEFSVEMNDSFLSRTDDPPFSVEYEVDSESDNRSADTGSQSSVEDIYVVCDESDIAFWADSESDDNDRSDDDIIEADKWRCCECDTVNNPLHRYCDRCWKLRPGWLPEQLMSLQQKDLAPLGCSCTSWSQDHKNHIASARTQAWAECVNKSLSHQESMPVTSQGSDAGSVDTQQDATVGETQAVDRTAGVVDSDVSQAICHNNTTQCDASLDVISTTLSTPPPPVTPLPVVLSAANHGDSDSNASDTCSVPSSTYQGVKLSHCDTMPIMDSLGQQQSTRFFGDSLRTSSVVSADSIETDSLMTSVTRDDSGIGLGFCHVVTDGDDLAMADIYKHGPRDLSTPSTPGKVAMETSDSLGASFDILSHPSTPAKNTVTSTSSVPQSSDVCVICLTRPKEASIIHGNTGHQVCCYVCAKRLRHRKMPCPVCRRPISGVIKNYIL